MKKMSTITERWSLADDPPCSLSVSVFTSIWRESVFRTGYEPNKTLSPQIIAIFIYSFLLNPIYPPPQQEITRPSKMLSQKKRKIIMNK